MTQVTLNSAKNGIEIKFDSKPSYLIIERLKENGFRWSRFHSLWYAKQSTTTLKFAEEIKAMDKPIDHEAKSINDYINAQEEAMCDNRFNQMR